MESQTSTAQVLGHRQKDGTCASIQLLPFDGLVREIYNFNFFRT
jgi:hypothetical protein